MGWTERRLTGGLAEAFDGGSFTPVIDVGDRATLIARQVAWAPDGQSIYAAVADINADIVLLDGLI